MSNVIPWSYVTQGGYNMRLHMVIGILCPVALNGAGFGNFFCFVIKCMFWGR